MTTRRPRRDAPQTPRLGLLTALTVALLVSPLATAATYDVGTFVAKTDADYTPTAETIGDVSLCYIDDDGSGAYTMGEPLILDLSSSCGEAAIDDRCLVCLADVTPGHEITVRDLDWGRTLHAVSPHNVSYVDLAGEGEVSDATPVYLDIFNVDQDRVDVGDVRLTAYDDDHGAMTVVQAGDPDMAFGLSEVGGSATKIGDSDVLYEAGDGIYLNVDKGAIGTDDTMVEDSDIRLNAGVENPHGDDDGADDATEAGTANITVRSLTATTEAVPTDGILTLTIAVENTGEAAGSRLVATTLDGQTVDARGTGTLAPGETARLVATLPAPDQPGNHTLAAGDAVEIVRTIPASTPTEASLSALEGRIGTLEDQASEPADRDQAQAAGASKPQQATTPALGPVVAMLAVLGMAILIRRR